MAGHDAAPDGRGRRRVLPEVSATIPMESDMEIAASRIVTAMAEFMRMSPDRIEEVGQAVVEACINAFEHSHALDRKVYMTVEILGDTEPEETLRITVRDNGTGFAPDNVEEPSLERKLKAQRKRGWGLKIIRELMDEVDIQSGPGGTTVVMSKSR